MVLAPTDPVAPRIVTARGTDAALPGCLAVIPSPYQDPAGRTADAAAQRADDHGRQHRRREAVETIHNSSMAGQDVARVLGPEPTLDGRFQEIAELRCHRQQQRDDPEA